MSDELEKLVHELVKFLESERSPIPLVKVLENFSSNEEAIKDAIQYSINELLVNKVLDYPDKKWDLYSLLPLWHLKKLNKEEADELRNLPPVELAAIRVLQEHVSQKGIGRISSHDLRSALMKLGFDGTETEFLWIEGWVEDIYESGDEQLIRWYRLIPEDEKTEEYKKAEEEMLQKETERDIRRQIRRDIFDLACWIVEALENKPDGLPKDKIVEQLPECFSDYFDTAFRKCLEDEDIERVKSSDDIEWYRLVVHDEGDDV